MLYRPVVVAMLAGCVGVGEQQYKASFPPPEVEITDEGFVNPNFLSELGLTQHSSSRFYPVRMKCGRVSMIPACDIFTGTGIILIHSSCGEVDVVDMPEELSSVWCIK